ncbi:hypothetical protein ABSA28_00108 [Candidatus Hepatincolaceae symbiont of Richtersius coronifer]
MPSYQSFIVKLLIILLISMMGLNITPAFASISLSKNYVLFDNKTRNQDNIIFNRSNKKQKYKISFLHFTQNTDGSYTTIEEETDKIKFAEKFLMYTPRSFTLEPEGYQLIRMQKRSMIEASEGEYITHMLISEEPNEKFFDEDRDIEAEEDEKGLSFNIQQLFAVSFPIVIRKGDLPVIVQLKEAIFKEEGDNLSLNLAIAREGNRSVRGVLSLKRKNKIIFQNTGINIFLNSNLRTVSINLADSAKAKANLIKEIKGKNIIIEYQDEATKEVYFQDIITY